jgi:hypothetical protein
MSRTSIYLLSLLLTIPAIALAQQPKSIVLHRTTVPVELDGVIDSVWAQADSAAGFIQQSPFHGKPCRYGTVAKLLATDEAIYCIMICTQPRERIENNTGRLDDASGDFVSVMFDTFGDKRTAYKIGVYSSGVRLDCRLLDDGRNRDYNWDGVWFAGAKVYDWGYIVEMEIPFKSIQYDEKLTDWGLDFDRWTTDGNEDSYWNAYAENEGQRISRFGTLRFDEFKPKIKGLNLEVYPVGILNTDYISGGKYKMKPDAGIDLFYNPSQALTVQLTANPDFAQIEADPFAFNISRYESYFNERRPFFTQGNEIFMPSGRDLNMGFYQPIELFYSRRIGKRLPDGSDVPLLMGAKAFGRAGDWEYGGFYALCGATDYTLDGKSAHEQRAHFASARLKKQILGNSSVGLLFIGKQTNDAFDGVLDVDGAFRGTDWQLSYQLAGSLSRNVSDFAISSGYVQLKETWVNALRLRHIGADFNVQQVGYVPWIGTTNLVFLTGPRWYFKEGVIRSILAYGGASMYHERVDCYTDMSGFLGMNMQFRDNWGFEVSLNYGDAKDAGVRYNYYEIDLSTWLNMSSSWWISVWGGHSYTYNFPRQYSAYYSWIGSEACRHLFRVLDVGTTFNAFIEGRPDGGVEDITINARPYLSLTPVNNVNIRLYCDNVWARSGTGIQRIITGFLFSCNFLPKSWIYLAINELRERTGRIDETGAVLPSRLLVTDRAAVFKIKYLYYF